MLYATDIPIVCFHIKKEMIVVNIAEVIQRTRIRLDTDRQTEGQGTTNIPQP